MLPIPAQVARPVLASLALLAAFAILYWDVLAWLIDDWDPAGNYSHGFLIVPLALYFAWRRRALLRAAPRRPGNWAFLALAASMAMLLLGTVAAETFVARLSMIGTVVAVVWCLGGTEHLRILRFPLALLLLMIPIPDIIFNRVAFPLQLVASRFGEAALSSAGVPVFREGNLIILPTMTLEVAEACSGIRSLTALFTLSVLYAYTIERRAIIRAVLLIATIPIAIFVNGLRVAATGMTAYYYGPSAADGFFHSTSGWAMFLVAGAAMVGVRAATDVLTRPRHVPAPLTTPEEQPS